MATLTTDHRLGRHHKPFLGCPICHPEDHRFTDGNDSASSVGTLVIGETDETVAPTQESDTDITREAWMLRAVDAMRSWMPPEVSAPLVRISIGWPGGRGSKKNVRGQCWAPGAVADGIPAIFVSPDQDEPITILGIILHEMIHAAGAAGHRSAFAKIAGPVGFLPPWTSSEHKSPFLADRLAKLYHGTMGAFPHARVNKQGGLMGLSKPPVQSTRMLLVKCGACGCVVRMTRKWLDNVGAPTCGCGAAMAEVTA